MPVREAYERGARKIVVIRTGDVNFQAQSAWLHKLKSLVCATGHCPKTINYLVQHEQAYQQELAFIANPPADVEIIQIFAGTKLHSKLLGSADSDLRHDYKIGVEAGRDYLFEHGELNLPIGDTSFDTSNDDLSREIIPNPANVQHSATQFEKQRLSA